MFSKKIVDPLSSNLNISIYLTIVLIYFCAMYTHAFTSMSLQVVFVSFFLTLICRNDMSSSCILIHHCWRTNCRSNLESSPPFLFTGSSTKLNIIYSSSFASVGKLYAAMITQHKTCHRAYNYLLQHTPQPLPYMEIFR